ncbi:hypothetical protein H4R33_006264, partial [Dimargaris cristalligena]
MYIQTTVFTLTLTTMVAYSHGTVLTTPNSFGQLSRRSLSSGHVLPEPVNKDMVYQKPNSYDTNLDTPRQNSKASSAGSDHPRRNTSGQVNLKTRK